MCPLFKNTLTQFPDSTYQSVEMVDPHQPNILSPAEALSNVFRLRNFITHLDSSACLWEHETTSPPAWFPHSLFPKTSKVGPLPSLPGCCSMGYKPQKDFYPNRYTHLLTYWVTSLHKNALYWVGWQEAEELDQPGKGLGGREWSEVCDGVGGGWPKRGNHQRGGTQHEPCLF